MAMRRLTADISVLPHVLQSIVDEGILSLKTALQMCQTNILCLELYNETCVDEYDRITTIVEQ